eukprot:TRINITY_DN6685_c0_g1_i1.p2 TRINITY_DN6685_c0_g1~~TRINITY_DN6685_c0_g1_i1.p2  ORF type:complete len:205 (-),score=49.80 TRINITY_DN6685_c0_g1_i1:155-709(-)
MWRAVLLAPAAALIHFQAEHAEQTDAVEGPKNVRGNALDTCSKPGMAMTGFTRDGHCQDVGNDDEGSHHICIKMKEDFCTVTGQDNWCTSTMTCMTKENKESDDENDTCRVGNWCVCQWAFARYIKEAGGCDSIDDIVCDSTNMAAMKAYKGSKDADDQYALKCIEKRCSEKSKKKMRSQESSG